MKKITLLILTFLFSFSGFSQVLNEGFEGGAFPPTAPGNWAVFQNAFGSNAWTTNTAFPHTGTTAAYVNSRQNIGLGNTSKDFLATPLVTVPANGELRFWTRTTVAGNQGVKYQIRIASGALPANQTDEAAYTTLVQEWTEDQLNTTYNVYEEKVVSLTAFIGQSVYIAFVDEYTQPGTGLSGDTWLLDGVKLVSQCLDPTSLTASGFTLTSANLSWGNPSGATSWEIEIMPAAATPTGFGLTIGTNTYTATQETSLPNTPLQPGTSYKYYVKALCTAVGSQWVGPFTFSTATPGSTCLAPIIVPSVLPYVANSDTALYGNNIAGPQGAGCAGGATNYMTGNDVVYSFTPTTTGPITITLTPTLTNTSIFVYNSCANIGVSCLAGVADATNAPRVIALTVTAGQTYYIVISKRLTPVSAPYNLTIIANTCTNLAATFGVVSDCANGAQFFVTANVTNLGSATSILATDNQASAPQVITATGVVQFGPFPNGTNVAITLQNQQDSNCFLTSANQTQTFCPATNDLCSGATPIACGGTATQTTVGATTTGAPTGTCGTTAGAGGLWYSYVGTGDIVTFSLCGSAYDTKIQVVTGACGTFTCVAGNDDSCGTQSQVTFASVLGVNYYVYVFGYNTNQGVFTLNVTCVAPPPPPANDNCDTAILVPTNTTDVCTVSTAGTTVGATPSAPLTITPCLGTADDDVWFEFVATATTHIITLSNIVGGTTNLNHIVYSGSVCGTLTQLYCSDPNGSIATNLTIGNTYKIRVYTSGSVFNQTATFNVCITVPPINDNCDAAISVPTNPTQVCTQSVNGTTVGATPSTPTTVTPCLGTADDDVWFEFIATATTHVINLTNIVGGTTNLNHIVYSGDACGALTQLYCSDPNGSIAQNLILGNTYKIRVYSSGNGATLTATFTICITVPPVNDVCSAATFVPVNSNSVCTQTASGTISGATPSLPTLTAPCVGNADDDVWFQFIASNSYLNISLINVVGTSTNLNHAVYSGQCDSLSLVYCSTANTLNSVANNLIVGQVYYLRVYSNVNTPQATNFNVCISTPSTCSNSSVVCTANYGNTVGVTSLGTIGCLFSTPNPTYFTIQVLTTGPLNFLMTQTSTGGTTPNLDVDYAAWGPFTSQGASCTAISGGQAPGIGVPISTTTGCSYSAAATETLNIVNAQAGQFYVILITNYSNQPGNISLTQTNLNAPGAGQTLCCEDANFTYTPAIYCKNGGPNPIPVINPNSLPGTFTSSPGLVFVNSATGEVDLAASTPGIYLITNTLLPTGSCTAVKTGTYNIRIVELANATISYSAPTYCKNVSAVYTVTQTGTTGGNYTSSPLGGLSVNPATGAFNPSTSTTGIHTVYYTIQGIPGGCPTFTTSAQVEIIATPTITGTLSACIGATTQLAGSATAATLSPWSSSDLAVATVDSNGLVTGVTAGTATITYTNSNGCSATTIVTINSLPVISGTLSACVGNTTQLTGSDTPATTAPWTSSDVAIATIDANGLVTGVSAGTTVISYTNSNSCSTTATVTITLSTISGVLNACVGATTQLTGSDTPALTTPWTSSDVSVATVDTNGLVTGVAPGTAVITYTNSNGCITTVTVTINETPTISGTLSACVGETTQLVGSGTPASTTPWTSSNVAVATVDVNGLVTGISTGSTVITYTNSNGCTVTATVTITPLTLPVFTQIAPICQNDVAPPLLPISSDNGIAGVWSPATISTATAGTTTYTFVPTVAQCASNATMEITIYPTPQIILDGSCEGSVFVLTVAPVNTSYDPATATYLWTGAGLSSNSIQSPTISMAGTFTVTVTDSNGCQVSDSIIVPSVGCIIPRGISPNNDGKNESFDLTGFNVQKLGIFNRYGTEVYSYGVGYTNQWVGQSDNGNNLPDGTYYYVIVRGDGITNTGWIYINR